MAGIVLLLALGPLGVKPCRWRYARERPIFALCAPNRPVCFRALGGHPDRPPSCYHGKGRLNSIRRGLHQARSLQVPSASGEIDLKSILVDPDPLPGAIYDVLKEQCLGIELSENPIILRIP